MASLNSRVCRLEKMAPDAIVLPDPPRVAGRPREVAVAERIEWLQILLGHPHVREVRRHIIRDSVAQLQAQFPESGDARQIWNDLWNRHPRDDYEVNLQRYSEIRPHQTHGSDKKK